MWGCKMGIMIQIHCTYYTHFGMQNRTETIEGEHNDPDEAHNIKFSPLIWEYMTESVFCGMQNRTVTNSLYNQMMAQVEPTKAIMLFGKK